MNPRHRRIKRHRRKGTWFTAQNQTLSIGDQKLLVKEVSWRDLPPMVVKPLSQTRGTYTPVNVEAIIAKYEYSTPSKGSAIPRRAIRRRPL